LDLEFPDNGCERRFQDADEAALELEEHLRAAVRRRLVSEVPVSCYLSGDLIPTIVLALSSQESGRPLPSLTIGWTTPAPMMNAKKRPIKHFFFFFGRRTRSQCYAGRHRRITHSYRGQ